MSRRDSLLAVLVSVVWGVNFVVIDAGLHGVPPLLLLAARFALVAVPLVAVVPRPVEGRRVVVLVGLFMSLGQFSLLYVALHLGMPPGLASLVLQAQVMLTIGLAAVALGERPSARQVAGVLVGTLGLGIVAADRAASASLGPLLVTLGAALSWAVGNVVSRQARITAGLPLVVWSALVVPVPALLLSLVVDGPGTVARVLMHLPASAVLATGYTVYGASLFGYVVWNGLLGRYPAGAVVPFVLLVPPVGMTAAWLAEGERPDSLELTGAALLLTGVAVATVRASRRTRSVAEGQGGATVPSRSTGAR